MKEEIFKVMVVRALGIGYPKAIHNMKFYKTSLGKEEKFFPCKQPTQTTFFFLIKWEPL